MITDELLTAILNFATRFGFEAAEVFLRSKGTTIDDAIAALGKAKEKSIEQYIKEDAENRPQP